MHVNKNKSNKLETTFYITTGGIRFTCNKRRLSSILHSLNGHSFADPTEIKHPKNQNKATAKNHQVLIPTNDSIFINQKMELVLYR